MDASTEKKELRRLALARRDALCAESRAAASAEICRLLAALPELCEAGQPCTCMIRPEDIKISPQGQFRAKIMSKAYFGQYIRHFMDLGGQEAEQMDFTQTNAGLREGEEIAVDFVTESLRLLPDEELQEA